MKQKHNIDTSAVTRAMHNIGRILYRITAGKMYHELSNEERTEYHRAMKVYEDLEAAARNIAGAIDAAHIVINMHVDYAEELKQPIKVHKK